jgi:AraC family transcriptional regulator
MEKFPDFNAPGFNVDQYNQRFHHSNVVIRASAKSVEYPTHWTPLSLKCVLDGEEHYETNNAKYLVDKDHFLLFNNGKMYSSHIDSPFEVHSFTLNIAPAFERLAVRSFQASSDQLLDDPFSNDVGDLRFTEALYPHGSSISEIIKRIESRSRNGYSLDQDFHDLMEGLLRLQSQTDNRISEVQKVKEPTRREVFHRLLRTRDYIYSCYSAHLTIDQLAGVACMNAFYFIRQFRLFFGVTPHQLLMQRRMDVAKRLLRNTSMSITEVCFQVGFSDLSSFSKLFRRTHGFPPSARRM